MTERITLKGITWNHSRGFVPMAATAQRFSELNPNVEISWEKRSLQQFADFSIQELAARFDLLVIDQITPDGDTVEKFSISMIWFR